LGFAGEPSAIGIDLGYRRRRKLHFPLDPAIKRECIWHGSVYRRSVVLVDRANRSSSWLPQKPPSTKSQFLLTKELSSTDSMLASIADPQRAPEMLACVNRCVLAFL